MIPALSIRSWALIGTGLIVVVLLIALLATRATLAETKRERYEAEAKLVISNRSIDTLTGELDRINSEITALANGDANRIAASRQALKLAEVASAARQDIIDRLIHSSAAARLDEAQCEVSDVVKEVWP